jgi:hypothetical protein
VAARRFQHREGAGHIGQKISFRKLYRRHNIGARRQMEDAVGAVTGTGDGGCVGDIGLDDLEPGLVAMLLQIGLAPDSKIVQHPHTPPFGD